MKSTRAHKEGSSQREGEVQLGEIVLWKPVLASAGELKGLEHVSNYGMGLSCHFVQAPEDEDVERHLQAKVSGFQSNTCTFIGVSSASHLFYDHKPSKS